MQQALRGLFVRWGLPQRLRVDNGAPWSTWADLPPALVLWWVGLGIEPIFNHRHCPTENAKVERCNGLIAAWGEPGRPGSPHADGNRSASDTAGRCRRSAS